MKAPGVMNVQEVKTALAELIRAVLSVRERFRQPVFATLTRFAWHGFTRRDGIADRDGPVLSCLSLAVGRKAPLHAHYAVLTQFRLRRCRSEPHFLLVESARGRVRPTIRKFKPEHSKA